MGSLGQSAMLERTRMSIQRCAARFSIALVGVVALAGQAAACERFYLPESFSIKQSTGTPVSITISEINGTEVSGSLKYGVPSDGDYGELIEGYFDGQRLTFTAIWRNSSLARYEGELSSSGRLRGSARWGTNSEALFQSIQKFACAE